MPETEAVESVFPPDYSEHLDDFLNAYIQCALWSSCTDPPEYKGPPGDGPGGYPLDADHGPEDLAPSCHAKMTADCALFLAEMGTHIETATCKRGTGEYSKWAQAGHDFWLTRNEHGCGFWDGDWSEPEADLLDKASDRFGVVNLYVGDDGLIYGD